MEQIVKYSNRKLYSRTEHKHVSLKDIREMLVAGKNVNVIDHLGNDITSKTLSKVATTVENVPVSELTKMITNG